MASPHHPVVPPPDPISVHGQLEYEVASIRDSHWMQGAFNIRLNGRAIGLRILFGRMQRMYMLLASFTCSLTSILIAMACGGLEEGAL